MKKNILFVLFAILSMGVSAQNKTLNYFITINQFQKFYNNKLSDSLYNMYAATMKAALSGDKNKELINALHAQFGKLKSTELVKESVDNSIYKGVFDKDELYVIIALNDKNQLSGLFFKPIKNEAVSEAVKSKSISNFNIANNDGDTLFGTLQMPKMEKEKPNIVLFIAGSGPTDRNCNSILGVNSNAFLMLADSLAAAGIASVRYDKRGVGESAKAMKNEADINFDDMINDAIAFIKKIKTENKFGKIIVMGHSEGSLVGMVAAQREKVDAYISLAGAGESADKILSRQINEGTPEISDEANSILNSLKNGKTIEVQNEELSTTFRSSVQPYLISWFAYDPQTEIKKLQIPILIIQGSTDLQVSEADAQKLKKAVPQAQLSIIPKMNHVLKDAPMDRKKNMASYSNPDLPLSDSLTKLMLAFCKQ